MLHTSMDPALFPILALIAGLVLGGGVASFFASRRLGDVRAQLDEQRGLVEEKTAEFKRAIAELGDAQIALAAATERASRADELSETLEAARAENAQFKAERAGFAEQKRLLEESRDTLLKEFENTGAKVLQRNQEQFLERAEQRFKQSEETGEAKIRALLRPVGEKLASYENQVTELEAKRTDAFGQ